MSETEIIIKPEEDPLLRSIKLNYVFYLLLLVCLFIISYYTDSSFLWCIITFIYVSFNGYFVHYLSHQINLGEIYKGDGASANIDNYISAIPGMNNIILFLCKMFDFHSEIHHDTSINKKFCGFISF